MAEHLADLEALLDGEGMGRAVLLGHSFGGVVALEAAARLPDRVVAVVAWEPPYGPLAEARVRRAFARVARATVEAGVAEGRPAAARAFMRGVAGRRAWDALPERTRTFLEAEGGGAVADAAMRGLEPDGLARIACPVTIVTGSLSEPFYAPIADALAATIPGRSPPRPAGPSPHCARSPIPARSPSPPGRRWRTPASPSPWSPPDDTPARRPRHPDPLRPRHPDPLGPGHGAGQRRRPGRGRRHVRPDQPRLRPDEPHHQRLPGAALATTGRGLRAR